MFRKEYEMQKNGTEASTFQNVENEYDGFFGNALFTI